MPDPKPLKPVSVHEIAEWIGVDERRVQQLVQKQIIVKLERGKYDLKASMINYIAFIKKSKDEKSGSKGKDPNDRLKIAQASRMERMNMVEEGKLVVGDNIEVSMNDLASQWFKILTAIPLRIKRRLPEYAELRDEGRVKLVDMIDEEIRKHQNLVPNLQRIRDENMLLDPELLAADDAELEKAIIDSISE